MGEEQQEVQGTMDQVEISLVVEGGIHPTMEVKVQEEGEGLGVRVQGMVEVEGSMVDLVSTGSRCMTGETTEDTR